MHIFSGTSNPALSQKIAEHVGQPLGRINIERFPDGEIFVKIEENIRGQDVFIIQPTCNKPNDYLMELLLIMDACKRASAARINAVIPYYGYARQDRKDQPRVPISAKLVADMLMVAGASRLLAVDLHCQQIQGFFDIPVDHLYASTVIVDYLRDKKLENPVVVSPDPGGLKMAYAYSNLLGAGLGIVGKNRTSSTEVEAINLVGEVEGCNCILVDDLSTTAGTLTSAAELLAKHGAKSVIAAVSHATMTEMGLERLKKSNIEELITTDTVPEKDWMGFNVTVLSVSQLLAEAIQRIHHNQSVTSLFKI